MRDVFRQVGYRGFLSVEYEGEPVEAGLSCGVRYLRGLLVG